MSDPIYPGTMVRITNGTGETGGFRTKPDNVLFDPTEVLLWVRHDTETEPIDVTVSRDEEGFYHGDFVPTDYGLWWYHWEGDGVERESYFMVERQNVPEPGS